MLKIGIAITNICLLLILSVAIASPTPNNNGWMQGIHLQNQSNTDPTHNLSTLTQHLATVKQSHKQHTANTLTADRPNVTVTVKQGKPSSRTQAVSIKPKTTQKKSSKHLWNLQNVDIMKVIAEVSQETGKNFIVDPQVSGKVTIVSSTALNSDAIYQVFLSTLQVLGYAAVPSGHIIKIMPLRDANRLGSGVMNPHTPQGDNIIVQVIPLHYVSALQLVPILNPLIPTWANVAAVTTANSLIVSGTDAVVNRVMGIVQHVDTPAANGVDVITLQYATAENVATEINKLIESSRAYGDTVDAAVSADDRSNSLMITGNRSARLRIKVLVTQLDQGGPDGMGDTQVLHLHYIQVQDILPILRGIAHQNSNSASAPVSTIPVSSDSNNGSMGGNQSSFSNQVQSITNAQLNSGAVTGDTAKQPIVITGDVTNNALIITAPSAMMFKLKNVVSHLDVRPEQVLVQGIIAEVDASKAQNLGIQWGSSALSGSDSSGNSSLGPTTAFAATGGLGVGFIQSGNLRGLVQLLGSNTGSNILSTPSITVLNNGHADIEVGKTISETTGEYQPTTGTPTNPFTQFQDKNVGLVLRVTPQITGDNSIRLAIDQTNSSIISDTDSSSSNPNPSTNQEKISTSVLVNNGQVLVLGGLISSQKEEVVSQVPFLGDIPILGYLFKHTESQNVKKDLLVFLRPIVITNPEQANEISKQRYEFIRDRQILNGNHMGEFTASSTLMSATGVQLPVPFSDPNG